MLKATTAGVYLLLKAGVVVYVGQSRNVEKRLNEHRWNEVDFDQHQVIETPAADLKKVEQEHILKHRPALNGWTNRYGGRALFDSSGATRSSVERQRDFATRMKGLGLKRVEFWAKPGDYKKINRWVNWLRRKRLADPNYQCFLKPERS